MIKSIHIKNFKSVVDLQMDLGSFNVIIGENGAGKSNILESICFGAAASANKLDFEFLGSRGIRMASAESMVSAFAELPHKKNIEIVFEAKNVESKYRYSLTYSENNKWIDEERYRGETTQEFINSLLLSDEESRKKALDNIDGVNDYEKTNLLNDMVSYMNKILERSNTLDKKEDLIKFISKSVIEKRHSNDEISNFIVFAPEQTSLRKFEDTTQIYPLGIKGEGIFQYLSQLDMKDPKNRKMMKEVKENLMLLDWYEDFKIPTGLLKNERSLSITDRFLREDLSSFDQRSTNEGFLFLLFYSVLFCSPDTPAFFAIDNIDSGLNPKLTRYLVQNLAKFAKKYKKQVLVTTHSPAVLDGLDLKNKDQRLFVARRNGDGYTTAERIKYNSERTMPLSELWVKGYIGGLPDNF